MGKRKSSQSQGAGGNRVVYSEFATQRPAATERAIADLPPSQQTVKVEVSRKGRGGKIVTVISGFQHRPDTLKALAKKLKAQCGTGGTVKDNTIEIQGEQADTVLAALHKAGYTAKRSGG